MTESRTTRVTQLRLFGLGGIAGSLFLLVSDWILLGAATSGRDFNDRWLQILMAMPEWRLTVGGLAGPIGACLYAAGFWHLYLGLRPGHRLLSFACCAGQASSFVVLAAFHAAFPFVAHLKSIQDAVGQNPAVDSAYEAAMQYFGRMYYVGLAIGLIGVVLLIYLLLFTRTRYPRWIIFANPAFLWVGCFVFRYLPAPLGGPLFVGAGNISYLAFFVLSTCVLWRGGVRGDPIGAR